MAISEKEDKNNTKQFLIYTLMLMCIIAIGFYVKQKGKKEDKLLDEKGEITVGNVVSIRYTTRGDWVRYMYEVKGNSYKDVRNTYKKGISVGQKYEVEYLPSNPEVNRINLDKKLTPKENQ